MAKSKGRVTIPTDMDVVKELASDDKAYRSLTLSWFKNWRAKQRGLGF